MIKRFDHIVAPGVRRLVPYVPGKPVSELERQYGVSDIVKLASNENPLGLGTLAIEAIRREIRDLGFYPDGNGFAVKQALSELHQVEPEWITLGNGSNDILVMLAEVFLTPDDESVFSQYSFAVYYLITQAVGAKPVVVAANPADHDMPLGHDLSAMLKAVTDKTKIVFVANPNNPTGTWVDGQSLRKFVASIPNDTLVVIDQAYLEYVADDNYENAIPWVKEFPNLIVLQTFSKIHGLAGLRAGYSVSQPDIGEYLNRVRQPFNMNSLAQVASIAALKDHEHIERSRRLNTEGLGSLSETCSELGLGYLPSMGNFLLVDFGKAALPIYDKLLREGIIVRPVDNYGLPNHLRISIGTKDQNVRLMAALKKIIAKP